MMTTLPPQNVTALLHEWQRGNHKALDKLMPLIYAELRRIAHRYMRKERANHTLQTTALVGEAFLKLLGNHNATWQNQAHFYAVTAQVMRHILIDHARSRRYAKRGGSEGTEVQQVSLPDENIMSETRATELLHLDEALRDLAKLDSRKSQVVELRYFGGLTIEETAEVLGISPMTVRREWRAAKAWMYRQVERRK